MDVLRALGTDAVEGRIVRDRNRLSGGGVTAGIDFGLTLLAELRGEEVAKMIQLAIQYAPEPPFDAGLPHLAGPQVTAMMTSLLGGIIPDGMETAKSVRHRRDFAMTD